MYGRVDVLEVSAGSDRQLFYLVSTDLMTGSGAILSFKEYMLQKPGGSHLIPFPK